VGHLLVATTLLAAAVAGSPAAAPAAAPVPALKALVEALRAEKDEFERTADHLDRQRQLAEPAWERTFKVTPFAVRYDADREVVEVVLHEEPQEPLLTLWKEAGRPRAVQGAVKLQEQTTLVYALVAHGVPMTLELPAPPNVARQLKGDLRVEVEVRLVDRPPWVTTIEQQEEPTLRTPVFSRTVTYALHAHFVRARVVRVSSGALVLSHDPAAMEVERRSASEELRDRLEALRKSPVDQYALGDPRLPRPLAALLGCLRTRTRPTASEHDRLAQVEAACGAERNAFTASCTDLAAPGESVTHCRDALRWAIGLRAW
jgi:hypothetical protein